jgi:hypothetical protein
MSLMIQITANKVALISQFRRFLSKKFRRDLRILSLVVLLVSFSPVSQSVHASISSVDELDIEISPEIQGVIQDQPTVSVAVNPSSVNVGAAALVTVSLNHVPTEGYTSVELTCSYDPNLVEASNIVVASLFGVDPVTAINGPHGGRFIVAIAGTDGNRAMNDGAVIVFYVKGLQAGQMALECEARASQGDNVLTEIGSTLAILTILGSTPTPTLMPALCDKAQFIADINIPDGTVFAPGATFTKTWRLKNIGSCVWTTSYRVVFFSGEKMNAPSSSPLPANVLPGQSVDISVSMTAPSVAGIYRSNWMFQNATGALFGIGVQANKPWWTEIRVSGPSATPGNPTNSPTPSLTPEGPKLTASPTSTPTIPPTTCDKAEFIADVNIPPGTVMAPGTQFKKTWRLKNIGTCTWTNSYRIAFFSGEQMGALSSFQLPTNVASGAMLDISLDMTAPFIAGAYRGYWIFQNATGSSFGVGPLGNEPWFVYIQVSNTTVTPGPTYTRSPAPFTPTATQTPDGPTATPVAGVYYDFAAGMCDAIWTSGAGGLYCPGIDGTANGFVMRIDQPRLETGATDPRSSLLTFPQNVQNGYIQGIYPPIHIQNGDHFHSTLTCEFGATNCYVAFRLDYQVGSDPVRTFWGPFLERYEGQSYSVDIDLSPLAGEDVKFILTVLSAGNPSGDRALWVGPVISRLTATPTPSVPSATLTPVESSTVTPVPDVGMLTGQVHAGKPVTLSVYRDNAILVTSATANPDGTFDFTLPVGTYLVFANAEGFLGAEGFVTVSAGNTSSMPLISLPAGDIDGNNRIDPFDVLTIGINYNGALPTAADLNNDGIINVFDLELLASDYRKAGLVPWNDFE